VVRFLSTLPALETDYQKKRPNTSSLLEYMPMIMGTGKHFCSLPIKRGTSQASLNSGVLVDGKLSKIQYTHLLIEGI
jgi:hypothetical protein